jgi:hypothetical protein
MDTHKSNERNRPAASGRRASISITLLLCALLSGSCADACSERRVSMASQDLADRITKEEKGRIADPGSVAEAEESRVYIDSSLSMAGFVNPGGRSRFDEVLDSLGDYMPGCLLFRYGQAGETPPPDPA